MGECDKDICCRRRFSREMHLQQAEISAAKLIEYEKSKFSHVYQHHLDLRPRLLEAVEGRSVVYLDGQDQPAEEVFRLALEGLKSALASSETETSAVPECRARVSEAEQRTKPKSKARASQEASKRNQHLSSPALPAGMEAHAGLINQNVRVHWRPAAGEERVTEGMLRQAQGRTSIKVVSVDGDVVLIRASAICSIDALDGGVADGQAASAVAEPTSTAASSQEP